MKILQINKLYHPVIGGIETVVKETSESLNGKDDLSVDVLSCELKGDSSESVINGVKVFKAASFGKFLGMPISFDFFKLFFKIKNNYDLFIIHYPFPLAAFLTMFIPKEKLIIYYHSDIIKQRFAVIPFLPIINYSLSKAKKIIVSGQNIIDSSPLLRKNKSKCEVIPYGIDFDLRSDDHDTAVIIKSDYPNKPLLLAVGRLVYYKGFEYAVRAMVSVDATLLIIGQGKEEVKLKGLIKELGLEDKVIIIPSQPRLEPFLLAADIFIFPSTERSEAFGLVQVQAMAAGLPVINTYLKTGVEEVSLDKVTGITVQAKNSKALSTAINDILKNSNLKKTYGENARERYLKFFTKDIYMSKLKNLL